MMKLFMTFLTICGLFVFTACGSGNDTPITSNNNNGEFSQTPQVEQDTSTETSLPVTRTEKLENILIDNQLGIMWQDDVYAVQTTKPWLKKDKYEACIEDSASGECENTEGDTAVSYCQSMNLGGYSDWRLPSIDTLRYLQSNHRKELNYKRGAHLASAYWSSTTIERRTSSKLAVYGMIGTSISKLLKNKKENIRCVRGTIRHNPVLLSGEKGIYIDNELNLMWQDTPNVELISKRWLTLKNYKICTESAVDDIEGTKKCYNTSGDTAETYCKNLILNGYEDWRLPTHDQIKFVQSRRHQLLKYNGSSILNYWSSETEDGTSPSSYRALTDGGGYGKQELLLIRCVRNTN